MCVCVCVCTTYKVTSGRRNRKHGARVNTIKTIRAKRTDAKRNAKRSRGEKGTDIWGRISLLLLELLSTQLTVSFVTYSLACTTLLLLRRATPAQLITSKARKYRLKILANQNGRDVELGAIISQVFCI